MQFQVAAEAIVVAIKSETDVGADCLTVDQVRDIYRAGSPLTNWSQPPLDFDDVPLRVGGPNPDSNGFGFFGRYVLDAPEPSRVDLRSDYFLAENDEAARRFVVGKPTCSRCAPRGSTTSAGAAPRPTRRLEDARDEMLAAKQELAIALAERKKGISDERPAADKAKDQARVDAAFDASLERPDPAQPRAGPLRPVDGLYNGIANGRDLRTTPTADTWPTSGSATTSCSRTSCARSRSPGPTASRTASSRASAPSPAVSTRWPGSC